jgi:hypothetical protein
MKMRDEDPSRRKFLLGSSAAAAGALLIPRGPSGMASRPRPTSRTASRPRLAATATPATITGATVNPYIYGLSNWVQGAKRFDSYVGYPLATTIQKVYMSEGQYYTDPLPAKLTQLSAAGCQFIVCVFPSRTTDQSSQLSDFLQLLTGNGIVYQAALVNEWNTHDHFADGAAYKKYWAQYAPVVQAAGVPLALMVCASSAKPAFDKIIPGFPTDPLPDAYWIDYYATAYRFNIRLDTEVDGQHQTLLGQAKKYSVPVGIGEFGWSAGDGSLTMAEWNAYCPYLAGLATQSPSLLPLGGLYWGDGGKDSEDAIKSASDPRIPGIQQIVSAFQSASGARRG